jgi:hypothetical protein
MPDEPKKRGVTADEWDMVKALAGTNGLVPLKDLMKLWNLGNKKAFEAGRVMAPVSDAAARLSGAIDILTAMVKTMEDRGTGWTGVIDRRHLPDDFKQLGT